MIFSILSGFAFVPIQGAETVLKSIRKSSQVAIVGLVALCAGSASFAAAVQIDGGTSATVDGWQITPDVGVTVEAETGGNGLSITKTADFSSNSPLGIQFVQIDPPGDAPITITGEEATNSTGTDWTAFTYSVNSQATFGSVSEIFVPPFGPGVNYTTVQITSANTVVTYTGSQVNGSTSDWGTSGDFLLINDPIAIPGSLAGFTLEETPTPASGTLVPLPSALGQSMFGRVAVGAVVVVGKKSSRQRII
jgi:hypothetical protein